jgi:adenylate kinase family enzyme
VGARALARARLSPLRRVSLAGISGSGKTTLARALAERLGVPHVELDALHHGPGWTEATPDELRARVEAALAAAPHGWVADGNYESKLGDLVVSRADTFVWLDLPLPLALLRIARRTTSRLVRRTELWNGNRETIRNAIFVRDNLFSWAVKSHRRKRRELPSIGERHPHLTVVRLRSPRAVAQFLESVSPSQ